MDFANVWQKNGQISKVRVAEKTDSPAITRLLRRAPYVHMHADWRLPVDWLGSPGFVVLPGRDVAEGNGRAAQSPFLLSRSDLQGCLIAAADPLPAAWVRAAAVLESPAELAVMLAAVVPFLQETAVSELCWLVTTDWPNAWLSDLGFYQVNAIETYVKDDMSLPEETAVPHLNIRPVQLADMPALEKIEAAAFEPMWRHSADTLALASQSAYCFDVGEIDGQIVGFQFSTRTDVGAHLVRLTIDPQFQRQGIGAAMLQNTLQTYYQHGLRQASLNTQLDNISSQFLYRKFGFHPTGQRFPVWSYML